VRDLSDFSDREKQIWFVGGMKMSHDHCPLLLPQLRRVEVDQWMQISLEKWIAGVVV